MLTIDDNVSLVEGSNKSIVCHAIGTPELDIIWKMDDNIIESDTVDYNAIKQLNKTGNDDLWLSCVAENEFGIDSRTVSAKLIGKMIGNHNE